jgi:N-succinyldiaminopimelate aminotransferase
VFYDPAHAGLGRSLVRFAFCKSDAVLGEAVRRLGELSEGERA